MSFWRRSDPNGFYVIERFTCPICAGSGRDATNPQIVCADCNGYGNQTTAVPLAQAIASLNAPAPKPEPKERKPRVTAKMLFFLDWMNRGATLTVQENGAGTITMNGGAISVPEPTLRGMLRAGVVVYMRNGSSMEAFITPYGKERLQTGL